MPQGCGTVDRHSSYSMHSFRGFDVPKTVFWVVFGPDCSISALVLTSLPILKPTHPMHDLLYSQRWMLFPHIAGGLTALALGPVQFSRRLRQRNPARHRMLGKIYIFAVLLAASMAPLMAWHYPAFFPYSVTLNAFVWLVNTGAAFLTARNRHFEQHRRWMARSYAMTATFVLPPSSGAHSCLQQHQPRSEQLCVAHLFVGLTSNCGPDG